LSIKKASQKLTVKSVSQILGVSTATVSNAFNRPDQLSEELRQRILRECNKLGYYGPNPAARSLRTGATGVVGVMLADKLSFNFSDPCAIEFLQGVSEVLDDAQKNMLLMPGREGFYKEKSLEAIPERYIIYGPPSDIDILQRIKQQGKPIVSVDFNMQDYLSLNVDNYGGAKAAAKHVFDDCEGPVAVIGLRLTNANTMVKIDNHEMHSPELSISRQRLEAYKDAALEAGRPIPTSLIWSTHESTWHEGMQAAREALGTVPRPQALLCMSDQLALSAVAVARELNINVPDQLKIVGFDDTPAARTNYPQISTVYQPSIEKGRLAALMVLHPDRYEDRVLPTALRVRETS